MVSTRLLVLVLVARVQTASANMGKGWEGGDRAGDPVGIENITITREALVIDMRPMVDRNALAKVSATYHLDNRGPEQQLDLVFAMGTASRAFRVTLDGQEITSSLPSDALLPATWQPPRTTPGFDGRELDYYLDNPPLSVAFQVIIPAGRHELAVAYSAEPVQRGVDAVLLYQFGYVLSPARTWAGFGGLDLTVHVPDDWRVAVTPALEREGNTLRGAFTSVPADAVALTVQTPTRLHSVVGFASLVLFAMVAFGGLFAVVWRTRVVERRRLAANQFPSRVAAFGRGVAWGAAFCVAGVFAILGPDLTVSGQAYHRGFGQGVAVVGVVLGTILAIIIGWIVSHIAGRRAHVQNQE